MSKKSKLLSLLTAFATVSGAGFSLHAAYTQQQVDALVSSLTGGEVTEAVNVVMAVLGSGVTFDTLISWINTDGSVDLSNLSATQKAELLDALKQADYTYEKTGAGQGKIKKKDGTVVLDESQLKETLQQIKNYVEVVTGGDFVYATGSTGSTGSSGGSGGSTVAPVQLIESNVPTTAISFEKKDVAKSEAEHKKEVETKIANAVKDVVNSTTNKAVTVTSANNLATWGIETKDITDKSAMQTFKLDPTVNVNSVSSAPATTKIPESVKAAAAGKESSVITLAYAEGTRLPWKAQVQVKVADNLKNKKVNVYYIVNGVSYPCGQVVVDANGHVICNFSVTGSFVIVEA